MIDRSATPFEREIELSALRELLRDEKARSASLDEVIAGKRAVRIRLEDEKLALEKRVAAQDSEIADYVKTVRRLNKRVKELED